MSIHAKIVCGPSDVRRVDLSATMTFDQLSARLESMFNLESGTFMIKYTDDEGDKVTVTDDAELSAAFAHVQSWQGVQLRLEIFRAPRSPNGRGHAKPRKMYEQTPQAAPVAATSKPEGAAEQVDESPDHELARALALAGCGFPGGRRGGWHGGHGRHMRHGACRGWGPGGWGPGGCGRRGGGGGWGSHPCKSGFVADVTVPDNTVVSAGAPITKIWRLANTGEVAWPEGTSLLQVSGDVMLAHPGQNVPVEAAAPGTEVTCAVDLVAPTQPGRYISYFRLQGPRGGRFGQRVWVMLTVEGDAPADRDSAATADVGTHQCPRHRRHGKKGNGWKNMSRAEQMEQKAAHFVAKAAAVASAQDGSNPQRAAKQSEKVKKLQAKAAHFSAMAAELRVLEGLDKSVGVDLAKLTLEQQSALAAAQLTPAQAAQVCAAVTAQRHLSIVCDVSGVSPIVGTRFSKPAGDDTYDVTEQVFRTLPHTQQEEFEAMPVPDIALVIKAIREQPAVDQPTVAQTTAGTPREQPDAATDEPQPATTCEPQPEPESESGPEAPLTAPSASCEGTQAQKVAILAADGGLSNSVMAAICAMDAADASSASTAAVSLAEAVPPAVVPEPASTVADAPAGGDHDASSGSDSDSFVVAGDDLLDGPFGQLAAMGFATTNPTVIAALRKSEGDVAAAVETLLAEPVSSLSGL